jgi:hypothetical protein
MGTVSSEGYGIYSYYVGGGHKNQIKRQIMAHRFAYEYLVGPIPDGLEIDHRCNNRRCVNPNHLRVTTRKENAENRKGANRNSKTGVRGVHYKATQKKYVAIVGHNGKRITVGRFNTLAEADAAVTAKRLELFTHNNHERDEEITHGSWWGIASES